MNKKYILYLLLVIIILFSLGLRCYKLGKNPPSLNWDEVSHGYNAYSILKTGKDEWGNKFPLIFQAYGDYKLPLYVYLTAPAVALFGLNEFSIRLVSVLSGVGIVIFAYLISKKVFKDELVSLFSAFLAAVSPWGLFASRIAVEANLAAFLFSAGIYFLFYWQESFRQRNLCLTAVFFGLSLHAYNSARVLVPIFVILTAVFAAKKAKVKQWLPAFFIVMLFALPVFQQFFNRTGKARFDLVSLIDQGVINQIIEEREKSSLPPAAARIIYSKPTFFLYLAGKNYLSNLSPKYLFFYGGSHYQFSQPDHELLYLVTAPFLLLGLVAVFRKNGEGRLLALWFLASFLPSAITRDAPHVLRTLLILPAPMILTAFGLRQTVDFLKKGKTQMGGRLLVMVMTVSVLFGFGRWWKDYFKIYPEAYSWAWQYGYKEAALFVKENYGNYDRIVVTKRYGEPHEFLLFYLKYDPAKYQNAENKVWDYHASWYWIDRFDKFEFVNDWQVQEMANQPIIHNTKYKILLITSPGNYPEGWKKIKTIKFLDGKPAFEILEN